MYAENDQESSSMAFNENNNQVLICWEDFRLGTEYDLYCKNIDFFQTVRDSNISDCYIN